MNRTVLLLIICSITNFNVYSQNNISNSLYGNIENISFNDFQAEITKSIKKPLLNFKSNRSAREYKTKIVEAYKNTRVNFGGRYILLSWNAGMGTSKGFMVDCQNGNILDIPVDDSTSSMSCFSDESIEEFNHKYGDKKIFYTRSSNLLITRECDEFEDKSIKYHFFVFNQATKKFKVLKTISKQLQSLNNN